VRLLLDEMISFRVASELCSLGHDVVAIKRDRPELERRPDAELVRDMAAELRAVVTTNVRDFRIVHEQMLARSENHYGIIFTYDDTFPRNKASIALWVESLDAFLRAHASDDALRDLIHLLRSRELRE
jgi:predicted nuclease of predicted toxin-antitoxin system